MGPEGGPTSGPLTGGGSETCLRDKNWLEPFVNGTRSGLGVIGMTTNSLTHGFSTTRRTPNCWMRAKDRV
jgi:hypothetical protein